MCWNRVSPEVAYCRAGGRRRYNAQRRAQKQWRRAQIISMTCGIRNCWGLQKILAEKLGVSKSTISRDMWAIAHWREGALLR